MVVKTVESNIYELSKLLGSNYTADFYQREYARQTKQIAERSKLYKQALEYDFCNVIKGGVASHEIT